MIYKQIQDTNKSNRLETSDTISGEEGITYTWFTNPAIIS